MPGDPPPDSYLAWNGRRYAWPPPEGWYLATDGRWWAPAGDPEPGSPGTAEVPLFDPTTTVDEPTGAHPAPSDDADDTSAPAEAASNGTLTSDTGSAGGDDPEPDPRPTGPETAWSDLDGIDPKQAGRASRWQTRRRRLGGLVMFAVIAAAGVLVALAMTGRLDVPGTSPTTTIPVARQFDDAPTFVDDLGDRTASTRDGTAADPHRPGEVATVQRRPGTVAWQVEVRSVDTVTPGAFDALDDDERCVAAVVDVRAEQSPPVDAEAELRNPPTIEVVLDGVANTSASACGDPAALADELDATWWIEGETGTQWTRLFELFVVPADTAGLPVAVESSVFAAAPLPGASGEIARPDGASTVDDVAIVVEEISSDAGCVTLLGDATVTSGDRAIVDTRIDGRLMVSAGEVELVAGSCSPAGDAVDGRILRLAGGATSTWALGYEIADGAEVVVSLDGEPIPLP